MKKLLVLFAFIAGGFQSSFAQCPTVSGTVTNVNCNGGATGAITLAVSGDTASLSNPGLLISELRTDPPLGDSNYEWVELIATNFINFATTPYSIIFSNNGTATSKGWVEGQIPTPPPRNSTYAFLINSGTVSPGDVVYVGGSLMEPTGIKLRVKTTTTEIGDGGIGGAFTGTSGVLGNGGIADGVAVFNLPVALIDSNTVPVDAIFYGSSIGDAALPDTTKGFRLPLNDRYNGTRLSPGSFLAPEVLSFYSLRATGAYNRNTGIYTTVRSWSTNTTSWAGSVSGITLTGNSYLWSNGSTSKSISGLSAGTYTVTVSAPGGCDVSQSFTVTEPALLTISLSPGSVICNGSSTGTVSCLTSGGSSPYTYLWNTGATTTAISQLTSGTYTLTVTDAVGCNTTQSALVQQEPPIVISSIIPNANSSGFPVILKGSNLTGTGQVRFGAVSAASFTVIGDTSIQAIVPADAQSGVISVTKTNGCSGTSNASFTYIASNPELTVRLFIEGIYNGNGFMDLPLVNSGLSGNAQHADSVTLSLISPNELNSIAFSGKSLLRSNGNSTLLLPGWVLGNSYYIVIRHRNSIETWSKLPILFSTENTYYNVGGSMAFPNIQTNVVDSIRNTAAICGGNVISDGGSTVTVRGVCWSTSPKPTIALSTKTVNGSGTGVFTASISGLVKATRFYVRAYATNSLGTSYGQEVSFTTTNFPVDVDGNIYDTILIDDQVWMSKNLRVSKYRNGDPIPTNLNDAQWAATTSGAYAVYNSNSINDSIYGKLYNWYAVADPRGLCPRGWHVPSDAEWQTLESELGMVSGDLNLTGGRGATQNVGGKMKATGVAIYGGLWNSPNAGATNSSGFTGLPGGGRLNDGTFTGIGNLADLWTSTYLSSSNSWFRAINYDDAAVIRTYGDKKIGANVRCVKDVAPTVTTTAVSGINSSSATTGGNVTDAGGDSVTVRGVCWSTLPNPTVALPTKTINGSGSEGFTSSFTGLQPGTTYYLRAYATNGVGTGYGNEISFTTQEILPEQVADIDGFVYDTVVIGSQTWLKQNLRTARYRNGDSIPTGLNNFDWQNTTSGAYAIYNNDPVNDSIYGKLFNWYAVADPRGLCPTGWHVPREDEWISLESLLGGNLVAGGKMKAISSLWLSPNLGANNSSGFSGLPGGLKSFTGQYSDVNNLGFWWSSTSSSATNSRNRALLSSSAGINRSSNIYGNGFSVRCTRNAEPTIMTNMVMSISSTSAVCGGVVASAGGDSIAIRGVCWSTSPTPTVTLSTKTTNGSGSGSFTSSITGLQPGTTYYLRAYATNGAGTGYGNEISFTTQTVLPGQITDVEGFVYDTVVIGSQVWIKQNLRVSKYRNGDSIPTNLSNTQWQNTTSGACAIYNNTSANDSIYGKLYNWYAVADPRGLCPTGWHAPSDAEWTTLVNFLGGSSVAGGKMKAVSSLWIPPNTGATNSSGFTGLPGGVRGNIGSSGMGYYGYWWSSTQYSSADAGIRPLNHSIASSYQTYGNKAGGLSVRCVKDVAPTVTTSSVTGINSSGATCGGDVPDSGGDSVTVRGVCWSTSPGPTVGLSTKTNDGVGSGAFVSSITGLQSGTTYYIRAYATNSHGTSYGNQLMFTTLIADQITDVDGNTYDIVGIGTQVWMSENLKVSRYRNMDSIPRIINYWAWNGTGIGAYSIYNEDLSNDSIYGKLYNGYAIYDSRGLCPVGWHVPSDPEWITLIDYLGGGSVSGGKMKTVGGWSIPNLGATNASGFSALPGAYRDYDGMYYFMGYQGNWWFKSDYNYSALLPNAYMLRNDYVGIQQNNYLFSSYNNGFSVRCIKNVLPSLNTLGVSALSPYSVTCGGVINGVGGDSITARGVVWSTNPSPDISLNNKTLNGGGSGSFSSQISNLNPATTYYVRAYATNDLGTSYGEQITFTTLPAWQFTDIDGNVYDTVNIGTQVWMRQNIKTTKYRNGDPIPTNLSNSSWQNTTTGAYAVYNNSAANDSIYGKLYNWYAVADSRGLCPTGWHVPGDIEWQTLETSLGAPVAVLSDIGGRGGAQNVGGQMKSIGIFGYGGLWNSPNNGATNSSGFTGLPGGYRNDFGAFLFLNDDGYWWSSSNGSSVLAWYRSLYSPNTYVWRDLGRKSCGLSVRCVKD